MIIHGQSNSGVATRHEAHDRRASKSDRRRFTRVRARQLRGCLIARGIASDDVWVVDISLGGAFLRTPQPLALDESLSLELPRTGETLRLRGRVVSRRMLTAAAAAPGMGVRFEPLDPMSLVALREFIRTFAPAGTTLEVPGGDDRTAVGPVPSAPPPPSVRPVTGLTPAVVPRLTAAQPEPVELLPWAAPVPSAPRPFVSDPDDSEETRRLRIHVKGLIFQIGELQMQLGIKNREIEDLREGISRLQASNAQLRRS